MIVRLDFGGERGRARTLRVGARPGSGTQVAAQLGPHLPFRDSSVDEIFLDRAIAHADDLPAIMEELWRIAKPGTLVHARLPHASSTWSMSRDPRHAHHYTLETFNYFDPRFSDPSCPSPARFQVEYARLYLKGARRDGFGRGQGRSAFARVMEALVNRSRGMQYRWERWFAPLVGGFEEFSVVLSTVKDSPYA
jgi:SAM-dependent methyltransferase